MLKIKDDVDLKELEKFGFIITNKDATYQNVYDEYIYIDSNSKRKIQIEFEQYYDELDIGGPSCCHQLSNTLLNTIYNLIQAGLVEKVEEDK